MARPASAINTGRLATKEIGNLRRDIGAAGPAAFAEVYLPHLLKAQDDVRGPSPGFTDEGVPIPGEVVVPQGTDIPFSAMHDEIFSAAIQKSGQGLRKGWAAPRGFAKSTAILVCVMWWAAYKKRWFVVWTSETASQVEEMLASFIDEIEGNSELIDDFPHLLPKKDKRGSLVKWTDRDVVCDSGFRMSARGAQKATRGLRRGARRPDVIICDDSEGESTVGETMYPKVRRWLTRVLAPALAPGGDIYWVNTLIEWESITGALIRGEEDWTRSWDFKHLQAEWWEDDEGNKIDLNAPDAPKKADLHHRLLWPEYWPLERLEAFLQENGSIAYSYEMMNLPLGEGAKMFHPDNLRWATIDRSMVTRSNRPKDDWISTKLLVHVTAIDPAFGGRDYAAVVTVGVFQHDFFVREAWWDKGEDVKIDQVNEVVRQAEFWNSAIIVVEAVAAQVLLADEVIRKQRIPVRKVHPVKSKVDRALPVAVRAEQSHIYFDSVIPSVRALREILTVFPHGVMDDPVDAFVYAVEGGAELRSKFLVAS